MPLKEEFLELNRLPLLKWLLEKPFSITWWIYGAIIVLTFLTLNTLFCSVDSFIKKRGTRYMLISISPQIIHAGFLFILLAHLLSSYGSFKKITFVHSGSVITLPNGLDVVFDDINIDIDKSGFIKDWSAYIRYFKDGKNLKNDVIQPNNPSFQNGLGIYIKSVKMRPFPIALIEVNKDPGAIWALIGAICFMGGIIILLFMKIRKGVR